jgi:membrane associated rhomboid family serine protease
MNDFFVQLASINQSLSLLFLLLTGLLHILYAAGIAKDLGNMAKKHNHPLFLPSIGWVLAGLLGGIFTVLVYWLIHHSNLTKK